MTQTNNIGLFIFRRDHRINDNSSLLEMFKQCSTVYPIFIFTPEQVEKNKYKSEHSVQFMIESLYDLEHQIMKKGNATFKCFYGFNKDIIEQVVTSYNITHIGYNKDFTPYSLKRDKEIEKLATSLKVTLITSEDYTLHSLESGILHNPNNDSMYQKFTPFYNNILHKDSDSLKVKQITKSYFKKFKSIYENEDNTITLNEAYNKFVDNPNKDLILYGGRCHGKLLLDLSKKYQNDYNNSRNNLSLKTSQLSAYLKYGCLSVREVYNYWKKKFGIDSGLIRQLYWREFYACILYNNPTNLGKAMNPKYDLIRWKNDATAKKHLASWKNGTTGFPMIDASMRQMNNTGYMHNRARLIVASFLVKTLLIDWREGEKYFAQKLVDYDVASNNGNWQWIAGSGVDSQPYFRIFNPWSQSLTHDPDCIYIKTFVPELKDVTSKHIHNWDSCYKNYASINYPKPIVDYKSQRDMVLKEYKRAIH